MEDDAAASAQLAEYRNVLNHADLVVHEHDRRQNGVWPQRGLEALHVDQAVGQHVEVGNLEPLPLQLTHRIERGLVFGFDGDQVLALFLVEVRGTFDGKIDGLRGARRPHQFLRVAVDQFGDLFPRFLDGFLGFPAEGMRTRRGITEVIGQIRNHLGGYARIDRRRRRIIEVDRFLHCSLGSGSHAGLQHRRRLRLLARRRPMILQHAYFLLVLRFVLLADKLLQSHRT